MPKTRPKHCQLVTSPQLREITRSRPGHDRSSRHPPQAKPPRATPRNTLHQPCAQTLSRMRSKARVHLAPTRQPCAQTLRRMRSKVPAHLLQPVNLAHRHCRACPAESPRAPCSNPSTMRANTVAHAQQSPRAFAPTHQPRADNQPPANPTQNTERRLRLGPTRSSKNQPPRNVHHLDLSLPRHHLGQCAQTLSRMRSKVPAHLAQGTLQPGDDLQLRRTFKPG